MAVLLVIPVVAMKVWKVEPAGGFSVVEEEEGTEAAVLVVLSDVPVANSVDVGKPEPDLTVVT